MAVVIDGTTGVSAVQAGAVTTSDLPAGTVLQVVQSVKTDTSSFAIGATGDISGLSVSITPTLSTSKVLVTFCLQGSTAYDGILNLYRDATAIGQGDAAGYVNRSQTDADAVYDPRLSSSITVMEIAA